MEGSMHAQPIEPDRLLSHAGGLRALALQLLGDAHAAEDVLQDTFVRALSSPPRDPERLGGWLAQVARGLALNRRRNEAHRSERERRYAREQASQHAGGEGDSRDYDGARRGEVLRALVEEVLALDEPYKSALLMRYFEGATPTQIAERTRTPLATIASRLARGQAELRARLERRLKTSRGGFEGALALLAGPHWTPAGVSSAGAAAKAGSLHAGATSLSAAPGATTWLGAKGVWIGATTLALGVLVAWFAQGASSSNERRGVELATHASELASSSNGVLAGVPIDATVGETGNPPQARESLVPPPIGGPQAQHDFGVGPYEFDIEIAALDGNDHPSAGTPIFAAPEGHVLNELGRTDWNGRLRATWRGFAASIELVVQAERDGYGASPLTSVVVHAGTQERIQLALVQPTEPGLAESAPMIGVAGGGWARTVAGVATFGGDGPLPPAFERDAHENGVFVDPLLAPPRTSNVKTLSEIPIVGQFFRARVDESGELAALGDDVSMSTDVAWSTFGSRPSSVTLIGVVVGADGRAELGLPVSLVVETASWNTQVTTGEHGEFRFECPAGRARLVAGNPGCGIVREELVLEPGERTIELHLAQAHALALHLTDEDAKPLARWRVEAWQTGDARVCVTNATTRFDGRARLALPASGPYELLAWPLESLSAPPVTIARNVWSQEGDLELTVRGGNALAQLAFVVEGAEKTPLSGLEVRLWRFDRRAGVRLPHAPRQSEDHEPVRWPIRGLVPGAYRIEVLHGPGGLRRELALSIAARRPGDGPEMPVSMLDLQPNPQPTAELRLARADARELAEATLWRIESGCVFRSQPFSLALPGSLRVPSGASTLELDRHALGRPKPGERDDDILGVDASAPSTSATPDETLTFEAEGTLTVHELRGGTQVLELEPVGAKCP